MVLGALARYARRAEETISAFHHGIGSCSNWRAQKSSVGDSATWRRRREIALLAHVLQPSALAPLFDQAGVGGKVEARIGEFSGIWFGVANKARK